MSYRLATIITDAPLDFDPAENMRRSVKPELYRLFLRLEFNTLIEKMGLTGAPPESREKPALTVRVEQAVSQEQAEELLETFRAAEYVALLALPDLTAVMVQCQTGENEAVAGEFYFNRYQGDWNRLLAALFSEDIKKASHDVKDLTRTLLENTLPAEGFVFDTALAGYLLDATAGRYDIARLFASWFKEELPKPLPWTRCTAP